MKNFEKIPEHEQVEFINRFDNILFDLDGVLWMAFRPLPGAALCVESFKRLGKKIKFVTNSTFMSSDGLLNTLIRNKLSANMEDVANPTIAIINYLKSINFSKTLYVIGSTSFKEDIKKAGFKLLSDPPQNIKESLKEILEYSTDSEEVGAVVIDYDLNLTIMKVQKAIACLKRKDCHFIVGCADRFLPVSDSLWLIGNSYFLQGIKDLSGRDYYHMAKPSNHFNNFFREKFDIREPKRVLFVGDSLHEDMKLASLGGYGKLLVLTGRTTEDNIVNWNYSDDCKPDYYIGSIDILNNILEKLFPQTNLNK